MVLYKFMAKLSVVATPIGNLEDITLRALRILKEADVIACEDTRTTKRLLSHFDIHTAQTSFHAHSGEKGFGKILALLQDNKHVALVCDAGTPGISDPGLELVSVVREQLPEVIIEAIPGPSALATALSIAGLRAASFVFLGFLPLKKGRETLFKEMAASERATIFYESPHRIVKTLESLQKFLPEGKRVGLFRELTKMHEEALVGLPAALSATLIADPNHQRGEFVVIVEGE
jgi:16S rRNA (cytidine1402-2'-O)-methyltransferase